ncbi:MAG: hypothetical protein M5T61_16725 [Acidimicrobiia bacterium]|nr:hypothetical protein [Acidimicrobiia bacterium]
MRTRVLTALLLAGASVLLAATPAGAGNRPPPGGGGGAYVDGDGDPTATAGDGTANPGGGGSGGGGGGGGEGPPCEWHVVIEDDFQMGIYDVDTLQTQHSATGRWLEYWCEGTGAVAVDGYFIVPEGGLVDPAALAQQALQSVQIAPPAIRTSPEESGRLYVQIPTWLWIDSSWWQPYTATAQAGRVWSTVTARPVSVTWGTGDGGSEVCRGPGVAWSPGVDEDASNCTHTYRRSSASAEGGTFDLSATVRFEITWTSNAPFGGTLPAITRTSTLDVEVGEIQAIGTRGD